MFPTVPRITSQLVPRSSHTLVKSYPSISQLVPSQVIPQSSRTHA